LMLPACEPISLFNRLLNEYSKQVSYREVGRGLHTAAAQV
jgi:hypothetical protein